MNRNEITNLAKAFRAGKLPLDKFLAEITSSTTASEPPATPPKSAQLAQATVDLDRAERCGYPEVVYAEGKSVDALTAIFKRLLEAHQPVLATRLDADKAAALASEFPLGQYNAVARTFRIAVSKEENPPAPGGLVAIVSAGTSDLPVAEEARETLAWMGIRTRMVHDVGVAGPHRLLERMAELREAQAVIVVAGMEGALPSVVGGYLAVPVIAVPTSVGYGANFGGLAALLGMLNSCAANVTVVNIDAGFKAAYVAGLMVRVANK